MSEIYDDLNPKIAKTLDSRLATAATAASLLDPLAPSNFLYEGAVAYVSDEKVNYMVEIVGGVLSWVKQGDTSLVRGAITYDPTYTTMDLSVVVPDISTCYAVDVTIKGSSASANIGAFTNFPGDDKTIEFKVEGGKSLTFIHSEYSSVGIGSIVLEDGFNMTIKGRSVGNESVTFEKNGVAVVQRSAVQFMKRNDWVQDLLEGTIIDNLTSTSASESLSANQGRVLASSIAGKQDKLTPSNNINITGDVIKGVPNPWVILSSPTSSIVSAEAFIIDTYGSLNINYSNFQVLDLSSVAGVDYGKWFLPPGADPALITRWIQYDRPNPSTGYAEYTYNASATLAGDVVGTSYHPRLLVDSRVGDDLDVTFNTDGVTNQKVSMEFLQPGLYTIKSTLAISGIDAATHSSIAKMRAEITVTDGTQLQNSPALGGTVISSIPYHWVNFTEVGAQTVYEVVEATIEISTIGVNNAVTLSINNQGESFVGIELPQNNSVLRITKHR